MLLWACWPHPPPAPSPACKPTHRLAHCLACSPRLSVHLLPQQFSVEEGGLTQVLVGHGSSGVVATSPGPTAPSRAIIPTWLSWVPSPWAWAGSGHARQAHSSWMWLKHRLAVAAELLCLEEVSMGSSWESRRRPGFGGAWMSPSILRPGCLLTVSTSTAPCSLHFAWSRNTCSQSFTAGRNGAWMPARARERLSLWQAASQSTPNSDTLSQHGPGSQAKGAPRTASYLGPLGFCPRALLGEAGEHAGEGSR